MAKKKSRAKSARTRGGLSKADRAVLASLASGNHWLRAVLCTLARRGVALRRSDESRARALLAELSVYPLFKAGRFLFDLLELEDFMIDGLPPAILPTTLDAAALRRLALSLNSLRAAIDGGVREAAAAGLDASTEPTALAEQDLPALEVGYYLYEDVVLGAISTSGPLLEDRGAPES